jgi:hypothetical protein
MTDPQAEADKRSAEQTKAAQDADKKRQEEARKKVADERSAREKASKEAPADVKPTPTQEENDLAASGVHLSELEADGSEEQPTGGATTKDKEAKPAAQPKAGYTTRSSSS